MKKTQKALAIALCSVMSLSALAAFTACGGGGGGSSSGATAARICYDNLPDDGIEIPASRTTYTLKNVESRQETAPDGTEVEEGTVVTYENNTVTAKSAGTVTFTLKNGNTFRLEVTPAYATNPHNQYTGNNDEVQGSKLLGGTHDPSLIETKENGRTVYYIFSTGWNYGNEIRKSYDLISWQYVGKATSSSTKMDDIVAWEEESNSSIQWWAPDIVKAPDGGYWLYTCCVSNGTPVHDGVAYSKACIVLFYSKTLQKESFEYRGVLMQSAIPQDTQDSSTDINSIDPQIIYSPDGKMYMAYGSFGTGNWMLELNPKTGLRKDGTYQDGKFLTIETIRKYRDEAVGIHLNFKDGEKVEHKFYGRLISLANMEAPVIARHDGVTITDEEGKTISKAKTYYYSMHSWNGLDVAYQMWGGRSTDVWGVYRSTNGGIVFNEGVGADSNSGNKYMGTFKWENAVKPASIDIMLPGHNDLFTTSAGTNVAAYITRSTAFGGEKGGFVSQIHQYYLNSMGDIVINPNRYGGETGRPVTQEELFQYTLQEEGGYKFKMVALKNDHSVNATSVNVWLMPDGTIKDSIGQFGTWKMYGDGYIYFNFTLDGSDYGPTPGQEIYYGVVRTAWLDDQNKSGFTITCMGHPSESLQSFGLFFNNYSTMEGGDLVG